MKRVTENEVRKYLKVKKRLKDIMREEQAMQNALRRKLSHKKTHLKHFIVTLKEGTNKRLDISALKELLSDKVIKDNTITTFYDSVNIIKK